ncbi:DUF2510 domain-containing protein [Geodermatophilus sp. CPCC 205761]|uniref:DUF2510 domain-containing protein n=1 Tax=Geodermatophilus sp. CPCC 205761 TaxID=2936597 RepID=UPI003EED5D19
MRQSSPDTLPRPRELSDRSDPAVLYVRSYLLIRTAVGAIGILLPLVLIAGESWVRGGGVHIESSLSSYYHTSMQDVFVGALCIIAVLLATYLAGRPWTWDFWLSLLAGLALLGVVFLPIGRPGIPAGAPRCGSTPALSGCSPMEQLLGEVRTEQLHLIAAGGCFVLLAALSFLFARRERAQGGNLSAAYVHGLCGAVVLLSVAAAGLGQYGAVDPGPLSLLFAAETAAVWAFAASWLLAGRDLWLRLLRPRRGVARAVPRPRDAQRRLLVDGTPVAAQPGPDSAPDTNRGSAPQAAGFYPDPLSHEQYPRTERWFDGSSWTAVTCPVFDPSRGSEPAPSRGVGLPRPRGRSAHHDDLGETVSADHVIDGEGVQLLARCGRCNDPSCAGHPESTGRGGATLPSPGSPDVTGHPAGATSSTEQHEREWTDERGAELEVADLTKLLAASCPGGDVVLPRLERWLDLIGVDTDSRSSELWGDVPGQPMWYVGVYMWSWSTSTPWDERGESLSANLATFIDANGVPLVPGRPGAEFRGSYRPLAVALRKRIAERSARVSVSPSPVVHERALERHAAASHAPVAAGRHGTSEPTIPPYVERVLALRLDVLRLTAELDQVREAQQRLQYLYDGTGSNETIAGDASSIGGPRGRGGRTDPGGDVSG